MIHNNLLETTEGIPFFFIRRETGDYFDSCFNNENQFFRQKIIFKVTDYTKIQIQRYKVTDNNLQTYTLEDKQNPKIVLDALEFPKLIKKTVTKYVYNLS